ncbi:MAG: hypothetical protein ACWA5L_06875 [bacterium]
MENTTETNMSETMKSETSDEVKLLAKFWQSPFAVAAAVLLTTQAMLIVYTFFSGRPVHIEFAFPLIAIAVMMLVAGVFPTWNFISLSKEGFEQHAGLSTVKTNWKKVQNVRVFRNWVEVRHVDGEQMGKKKVRTARLLNRYGISPDEFGDLIETRWRNARGMEF